MYDHVFELSALLHGGRLEASNDPLFGKAETVAVLPDWPLAAASTPIVQTKPYRYWRLCAEDGQVLEMDELFLYDAPRGKPLKATCVPASSEAFAKMFDGNTLTNYHVHGNRYDGAVDLGSTIMLDHVSYLRRGDGNVIFPGDCYRVYYWDEGEWHLYSQVQANDIYLNIDGIPAGALYYIEDITNGFQNRIFTLGENGKDIVWH